MAKITLWITFLSLLILALFGFQVSLADTNEAVIYLESVQQLNGSWSTDVATTHFETTTVLDTFYRIGETGESYTRGVNYVYSQSVSGVEDTARRVTTLAPAGRDISADLAYLLDARNADGGWGYDKGYASSVYYTTLALTAVHAAQVTDPAVLGTTLGYITSHQNANGSFGFTGADESVYLTSLATIALQKYSSQYQVGPEIALALQWLQTQQNPDGSFGQGNDVIFETSLTYIALYTDDPASAAAGQALAYLQAEQLPDGSWNSNPADTAIALRATYLPTRRPDLVVESITTIPDNPAPGANIQLSVVMINQGLVSAIGPFRLDIYLNRASPPAPLESGNMYCSVPNLAPGARLTCSGFISYPAAGIYQLWAQADTFEDVEESDEGNNVGGPQPICVGTACFSLDVVKAGSGTGTVTSSPAGIDCGPDCSEPYPASTTVTLTDAPAPGSVFAGFSGDPGCSTADTSGVTLDSDKTCIATFDLVTHTLSVTKAGTGSGTVASTPAGINCGPDCSEDYVSGTPVTLTATADTGSTFTGWTGDPDCLDGAVTMDSDKSCAATFDLETHTLSVIFAGNGTGTVDIIPPVVTCDPGSDPDCTQTFDYGEIVSLSPTPDTGSAFANWSGDPDCSDAQLTMDANKSCTATFDDIAAPSVPQNVIATPIDVDAAVLSWDASTDSGGSGLAGYRVYATKTGAEVADTALTSESFSGLPPGDYSYYVVAYDAVGNVSDRSRFAAARLSVRFSWQTVEIPPGSGNTFAANPAGATATASFIFEGDAVSINYGCGLNTGIFEVSIDGAVVDTVDAYCSTPDFGAQKTYAVSPGGHKIRIRPTGNTNASSSYYWTLIDSFEVAGETYEEDDGVSYTWQTVEIPPGSGTTFAANPAGATASASFTYAGDNVSLNYGCGLNTGIFDVEIDGALQETVDDYCSPPDFSAQKTYPTTDDSHTITVRPTGDKNLSSSYYWTLIDSFEAGGSVYQAQALPRSEAEELSVPQSRLSKLLQRLPKPLGERIEKRLEEAGGVASADTLRLLYGKKNIFLRGKKGNSEGGEILDVP